MNEESTGRSEAAESSLSKNGLEAMRVPASPETGDGLTERRLTAGDLDTAYGSSGPPVEEDAADSPDQQRARWTGREIFGSIREIVETLGLALLFFFGLRAVVQNFRVEGSSMVPNFKDGQYVLVSKAAYGNFDAGVVPGWIPILGGIPVSVRYPFHQPERGDVIVFHPPPPNDPRRDFIKRVVAIPGDTVDVRQDKVYVNGTELIEPYIHQPTMPTNSRFAHVTLAAGQYYAFGDNRGNSSDSRTWGPVSADEIVGRTWIVYWPLSDWKIAPNHAEHVLAPSAAAP